MLQMLKEQQLSEEHSILQELQWLETILDLRHNYAIAFLISREPVYNEFLVIAHMALARAPPNK